MKYVCIMAMLVQPQHFWTHNLQVIFLLNTYVFLSLVFTENKIADEKRETYL